MTLSILFTSRIFVSFLQHTFVGFFIWVSVSGASWGDISLVVVIGPVKLWKIPVLVQEHHTDEDRSPMVWEVFFFDPKRCLLSRASSSIKTRVTLFDALEGLITRDIFLPLWSSLRGGFASWFTRTICLIVSSSSFSCSYSCWARSTMDLASQNKDLKFQIGIVECLLKYP